ncbi:MAG: hypothetical protein ABEI52_12440 [Halobacteriaceae archaeon]
MELARKSGKMWHFAEPDHCGWAQTFVERDEFEETVEVSSLDEVGEFCSMCLERRED